MPQGRLTAERIDSGAFAVSEYKHREVTHCYLLCGTERAVLIDTGLGGRSLTVIHTPGHSPGHCCFYGAGDTSAPATLSTAAP